MALIILNCPQLSLAIHASRERGGRGMLWPQTGYTPSVEVPVETSPSSAGGTDVGPRVSGELMVGWM